MNYFITRDAAGWLVTLKDGTAFRYISWGKLRRDIQRCEELKNMHPILSGRGTKIETNSLLQKSSPAWDNSGWFDEDSSLGN